MRNLRTEKEIMKNWQGELDKPLVSICCITYNHELYIEDALEGFLIQETDFPFEILIHDDASTDKTADIIREYQSKYPNLVKPIYQIENQYSKGVKINPKFNFKRANGEYIALCEGDDCWIESAKLQVQTEIMQKESGCKISYHAAFEVDEEFKTNKVICNHYQSDSIDSTKHVILGRGGYMPTASIMFVNDNLDIINYILEGAPIGDFFIQTIMALEGDCFYVNRIMSVYRRNTAGSWTAKQKKSNNKRIYSYKMLKGISRMKKKYQTREDSKWLEEVYLFYAKSYIFNHKGFLCKIKAFYLILIVSVLHSYLTIPVRLINAGLLKISNKTQ